MKWFLQNNDIEMYSAVTERLLEPWRTKFISIWLQYHDISWYNDISWYYNILDDIT